ncbi:hypothetical protein ABW19_dt0204418 [Dactylella cylindrospora]|nr:hypothetical protein ABW19_dt0204418 [Dactylella cylindrospora]
MIGEQSLVPYDSGSSWNVVKVENIPYNLDDDMLFEFLGKNPGILPEERGGVHIIMDRTTLTDSRMVKGKTMDCFLEFPSVVSAEKFIQRRCGSNRRCILGGRHINLELVRYGELMRWLFPKVRGASWDEDGALLVLPEASETMTIEIIGKEELVMILGHARTPHRFQALTVKPGTDYIAVEAIAMLMVGGITVGNSIWVKTMPSHPTDGNSGMYDEINWLPTEVSANKEQSQPSATMEVTMRTAADIELKRVYAALKKAFAPVAIKP